MTFKRKKFPPTRSHSDDLMVRRNERRNGKEIRYGNVKRGGVRGRVGSETFFHLNYSPDFLERSSTLLKNKLYPCSPVWWWGFDAIFPGKNLGLKIE